jgi:hypothetical protein
MIAFLASLLEIRKQIWNWFIRYITKEDDQSMAEFY